MISVLAAAAVAVVSPSGQSASVKVPTAGLSRRAVEVAVERAAEQACLALAAGADAPIGACVRDASLRAMRDYDRVRVARVRVAGLR